MNARATDNLFCSLCGDPILLNTSNPVESLSMDHVPPKQFYPKDIRTAQNQNLWLVPTHKRCNGDYRLDEEYFYHATQVMVQNGNHRMAQVVHLDLMRRTNKPQTPALVRSLLKKVRTVTKAGIYLPPGIVQFNVDEYRLQRVAIKIARGLFWLDQKRYIPRENCKDIRLCELETDAPEIYRRLWCGVPAKSVITEVFSYRRVEFEHLHLFSMLFWEAFMFCAAFENPSTGTTSAK